MLWVVHDTLGFSLLYSSYRGRAMFTVNPLCISVRPDLSYLQPPRQKSGQANTASFCEQLCYAACPLCWPSL